MDSEQSLLAAVIDDPENLDQRMIAADWYEEHSDPRAEFIRVQLALHQLPDQHEWRKELLSRERLLYTEHFKRWNAPLYRQLNSGPLKNSFRARRSEFRGWHYRRGFIEGVDVSAAAWQQHKHILQQLGPITSLKLRGFSSHYLGQLFEAAWAPTIQHLHLPEPHLPPNDLETLLHDISMLTNLRSLNLSGISLYEKAVDALLKWQPPTSLDKLILSRTPAINPHSKTRLLSQFGELLRHENGLWWDTALNPVMPGPLRDPREISYDDNVVYEDGRMYDEHGERDFDQMFHDDERPQDLAPWEEGDRNDEDEHWSDYVDDDWVS